MKTVPLNKITFFLISAGITGLIYIGIVYFTFNTLHLNSYVSVSIAYASAMVFYFVTNKLAIFKSAAKSANLYRQIGQFLVMVVINYAITLFLVWAIKKFTGEVYSGSVAAGIVTTLLAYFVLGRIFK